MPNETKNYDLVIIGGGPAGIVAATTATSANKKIAVVDCHHQLGGAGINTGTVPSKTLRETALALSGLQSRDLYGVDLSLRREVTIRDFLGHEQHVKAIFNEAFLKQLDHPSSDVIFGDAAFVDANTVSVQLLRGLLGEPAPAEPNRVLRGEKILIATGSSPVRPPLFSFEGEVYDSDSILNLHKIPKTLAVIGAGVIGSEYACTFTALGAKVHLIDGRSQLLPFLDSEVSQALTAALERSGVIFHWNQRVQRCDNPGSGPVTLTFASGETLTVDALLVAAGRKSNVDTLGLPKAGVATGDRGLIPVNDHYQTNVPHIYAAGDVIGFPALASTSMEQARRAVAHALDLPNGALSPLLPNGIYTIPEVSMVGETEESLKKKGIDYVVGRSNYSDNARGQIIGDKHGFLKLLFRREDMRLVGVHVIGELATEVVHIGLIAMINNASAGLFVEACFNVPTLGMLYKTATLAALRESGVSHAQAAPTGPRA
ncbi:MAG: Si-specific NAD(P)(+) transhydrogenase [Verrucomicrobiota bacterium]